MAKTHEDDSLDEIVAWLRSIVMTNACRSANELTCDGVSVIHKFSELADRIEACGKKEAAEIERIVRDAIVSYQEAFPVAPNDGTENELMKRTEVANAWLRRHGFIEEKTIWSKEEEISL